MNITYQSKYSRADLYEMFDLVETANEILAGKEIFQPKDVENLMSQLASYNFSLAVCAYKRLDEVCAMLENSQKYLEGVDRPEADGLQSLIEGLEASNIPYAQRHAGKLRSTYDDLLSGEHQTTRL